MMDTAVYCERLVREQDPDRYFTALFAPEARRPHLFALYAFNSELARVRESVSEPAPGEIRLAWWREVFEGQRGEEAGAHPVASAVLQTIADHRLPREAFIRMTEARVFDLYDDPIPTLNDLEGYAGDTSSALIRLASILLAEGRDPGGAGAAGHAGVAYAIIGLLRALPFQAQRGQVFLPAEVLARHGARRGDIVRGQETDAVLAALADMRALARRHLAAARDANPPLESAPAFLPLVIAGRYLKMMEQPGYQAFHTPVEIPQWRRMAVLWWAARGGRPLG